jgi:hypothetical protein
VEFEEKFSIKTRPSMSSATLGILSLSHHTRLLLLKKNEKYNVNQYKKQDIILAMSTMARVHHMQVVTGRYGGGTWIRQM